MTARPGLRSHGSYCRTLVDVEYDRSIRVRRYLCLLCKRTVSLLTEFALPYLRFSLGVIGLFLRRVYSTVAPAEKRTARPLASAYVYRSSASRFGVWEVGQQRRSMLSCILSRT
jgi:hypothetical protein